MFCLDFVAEDGVAEAGRLLDGRAEGGDEDRVAKRGDAFFVAEIPDLFAGSGAQEQGGRRWEDARSWRRRWEACAPFAFGEASESEKRLILMLSFN